MPRLNLVTTLLLTMIIGIPTFAWEINKGDAYPETLTILDGRSSWPSPIEGDLPMPCSMMFTDDGCWGYDAQNREVIAIKKIVTSYGPFGYRTHCRYAVRSKAGMYRNSFKVSRDQCEDLVRIMANAIYCPVHIKIDKANGKLESMQIRCRK